MHYFCCVPLQLLACPLYPRAMKQNSSSTLCPSRTDLLTRQEWVPYLPHWVSRWSVSLPLYFHSKMSMFWRNGWYLLLSFLQWSTTSPSFSRWVLRTMSWNWPKFLNGISFFGSLGAFLYREEVLGMDFLCKWDFSRYLTFWARGRTETFTMAPHPYKNFTKRVGKK